MIDALNQHICTVSRTPILNLIHVHVMGAYCICMHTGVNDNFSIEWLRTQGDATSALWKLDWLWRKINSYVQVATERYYRCTFHLWVCLLWKLACLAIQFRTLSSKCWNIVLLRYCYLCCIVVFPWSQNLMISFYHGSANGSKILARVTSSGFQKCTCLGAWSWEGKFKSCRHAAAEAPAWACIQVNA